MNETPISRRICRGLDGVIRCLPAASIRALVKGLDVEKYGPGADLFYRDHVPSGCHILVEGRISLDLGHSRKPGEGVFVNAPVLLGYMDSPGDKKYPVTARTATESRIGYLDFGPELEERLAGIRLKTWTCEHPCT